MEPRLPEATLLWGHTEVTRAENPVAAEQRSYDATDFEGLFEYLELSCNGVGLMACEIGVSSEDPFAYFGRANMCLLANQCLTYHHQCYCHCCGLCHGHTHTGCSARMAGSW